MIPPKKTAPPPMILTLSPARHAGWGKPEKGRAARIREVRPFSGARAGREPGLRDGCVRKPPILPVEAPRKTFSPRAAGQADRRQRPLEEEKAAAGQHSLL